MIKVENTAITTGISLSAKLICSHKDINTILDYGCGKLRNTYYILDQGKKVSIIDTPLQLERIKDKIPKSVSILNSQSEFDGIICSFVLNVIPDNKERIEVIKHIESLLKPNGIAYIEVRAGNFINAAKTAIPHNDGYILGKNKYKTFQKPYTIKELNNLLLENTNLEIINSKKYTSSIIICCKKKNTTM